MLRAQSRAGMSKTTLTYICTARNNSLV